MRIRKDPHHFAGSGSAQKPMDPDPDADPNLFHTKLRKDVLQMNLKVNKFIIISYTKLNK